MYIMSVMYASRALIFPGYLHSQNVRYATISNIHGCETLRSSSWRWNWIYWILGFGVSSLDDTTGGRSRERLGKTDLNTVPQGNVSSESVSASAGSQPKSGFWFFPRASERRVLLIDPWRCTWQPPLADKTGGHTPLPGKPNSRNWLRPIYMSMKWRCYKEFCVCTYINK